MRLLSFWPYIPLFSYAAATPLCAVPGLGDAGDEDGADLLLDPQSISTALTGPVPAAGAAGGAAGPAAGPTAAGATDASSQQWASVATGYAAIFHVHAALASGNAAAMPRLGGAAGGDGRGAAAGAAAGRFAAAAGAAAAGGAGAAGGGSSVPLYVMDWVGPGQPGVYPGAVVVRPLTAQEIAAQASAANNAAAAAAAASTQLTKPAVLATFRHRPLALVGLANLGNTCYLNAALQCLLHTPFLAPYFASGEWIYDLHAGAPLGSKGTLAAAFADLIQEAWAARGRGAAGADAAEAADRTGAATPLNTTSLAPRKLKHWLSDAAPAFAGNEQHDSQEALNSLLQFLSEDLNRVKKKPYAEQPDSDGRPDALVAEEWWVNHAAREQSIIAALFTGQFKSTLTCENCGHTSARFEPFTTLTLPLPLARDRYVTVTAVFPHPALKPLVLTLALPANGTVRDLKIAAAKLLGDHVNALASRFTLSRERERGGRAGGRSAGSRTTAAAAADAGASAGAGGGAGRADVRSASRKGPVALAHADSFTSGTGEDADTAVSTVTDHHADGADDAGGDGFDAAGAPAGTAGVSPGWSGAGAGGARRSGKGGEGAGTPSAGSTAGAGGFRASGHASAGPAISTPGELLASPPIPGMLRRGTTVHGLPHPLQSAGAKAAWEDPASHLQFARWLSSLPPVLQPGVSPFFASAPQPWQWLFFGHEEDIADGVTFDAARRMLVAPSLNGDGSSASPASTAAGSSAGAGAGGAAAPASSTRRRHGAPRLLVIADSLSLCRSTGHSLLDVINGDGTGAASWEYDDLTPLSAFRDRDTFSGLVLFAGVWGRAAERQSLEAGVAWIDKNTADPTAPPPPPPSCATAAGADGAAPQQQAKKGFNLLRYMFPGTPVKAPRPSDVPRLLASAKGAAASGLLNANIHTGVRPPHANLNATVLAMRTVSVPLTEEAVAALRAAAKAEAHDRAAQAAALAAAAEKARAAAEAAAVAATAESADSDDDEPQVARLEAERAARVESRAEAAAANAAAAAAAAAAESEAAEAELPASARNKIMRVVDVVYESGAVATDIPVHDIGLRMPYMVTLQLLHRAPTLLDGTAPFGLPMAALETPTSYLHLPGAGAPPLVAPALLTHANAFREAGSSGSSNSGSAVVPATATGAPAEEAGAAVAGDATGVLESPTAGSVDASAGTSAGGLSLMSASLAAAVAGVCSAASGAGLGSPTATAGGAGSSAAAALAGLKSPTSAGTTAGAAGAGGSIAADAAGAPLTLPTPVGAGSVVGYQAWSPPIPSGGGGRMGGGAMGLGPSLSLSDFAAGAVPPPGAGAVAAVHSHGHSHGALPPYFQTPLAPSLFGGPRLMRMCADTVTPAQLYAHVAHVSSAFLRRPLPRGDPATLASSAGSSAVVLSPASAATAAAAAAASASAGGAAGGETLPPMSAAEQRIWRVWGFTLRLVQPKAFGSGLVCSRCSWLDNCPGCIIEPVGDRPLGIVSPDEGQTIVADWDPSLLEEALDRVALVAKDVHPSVAACGEADAKATTLGQCMDAFSREELLDEPGYCGRCSKVRTRGIRPILDHATGKVIGEREVEEEDVVMRRKSKRIELWRVPPVLLVQLKRFHNTATARRKLHNQVAFPLNGLSLSPYMARARTPHPPPDLSAWQWLGGKLAADACGGAGAARAPSASASASAAAAAASSGAGSRASTAVGAGRDRTSSTGPREAVVSGLPCLLSRSKTTYDLYGVVCHEGILGAGHYTAFARSPHDDHWHEYNDRLVSDVGASLEEAEREIVTPAAYLLFYCRRDVGAGWRAALKAEDTALGRHTTEDPTSPPLQEIERALAAAQAKARADAAAARSRGGAAAAGGAGAGAGGARGGAGAVARAALRAARAADQQQQQNAADDQRDAGDDGEQDDQDSGAASASAAAAAAQDHRAPARLLRPLETWDLFPHAAGAAPSPELAAVRASMLTAGATVAEAAGFFDSLADKCIIM